MVIKDKELKDKEAENESLKHIQNDLNQKIRGKGISDSDLLKRIEIKEEMLKKSRERMVILERDFANSKEQLSVKDLRLKALEARAEELEQNLNAASKFEGVKAQIVVPAYSAPVQVKLLKL